MLVPGSANPLLLQSAAAAAGYSIPRSLRFNSSDSAYLSRTPASAGTSRTTWTVSFWAKRAALATAQWLFFSSDLTANTSAAYFTASDTIEFYEFQSGSYVSRLITTQVFRDPSAWYHFVFVWDTSNGTSTNRVRIYVNGLRVDTFSTSSYPSSGVQSRWNNNVEHYFSRGVGSEYFSGYLADIHFIDGQALTPTSFGAFDATTGVWNPIAYSGSYGTNGFHLPFSDNSAATATTLGKDTSGNGNNWTPNNLSVTAGAGNDSLVDSPTNGTASSGGDAGGTVVGNYCTLNALTNGGTLANGNLDFSTGASHALAKSTFGIPSSGLWYAEATVLSTTSGSVAAAFGLGTSALSLTAVASSAAGAWEIYSSDQRYFNRNGTQTSIAGTFSAGTILQLAVDPANSRAWVGVNNTWYDGSNGTTGNPGAGTNPTFTSLPSDLFIIANTVSNTVSANFGQRPFAYAAPAGFKSLNTANLPTPTILAGNTAFDTKLYTGNGSYPRTISGLSFSPDLIWTKVRSQAYRHMVADIVRGTAASLTTNNTNAESLSDAYGWVSAFNSDGWQIQQGSVSGENFNANNETYAAWCWDAGTTTDPNNTAGSITSTVRANASAGFSIVSWTGTANATVGHGLGVEIGRAHV